VPDPGEFTRLLAEWSTGNQSALDRLVPVVYDELRHIASHYMRRERHGHLLQTTALVNEAYLRLVGREKVSCQTRSQFFAIAAQVMRRVLVDYARGQKRAKRGGAMESLALDDVVLLSEDRAEELIAIDSALDSLKGLDPRKCSVFEMRYFGGMSVDEVSQTLSVSPETVARDWRMAKVWLRREIGPRAPHAS
jgi:RNA polymerase sigma-70 factor, ECF subfamily